MTENKFEVIYTPVSIATEYIIRYRLDADISHNSQTINTTRAVISENALINNYYVTVAYKVGDLTSDFTDEINTGNLPK